jgi:hypothetical protein
LAFDANGVPLRPLIEPAMASTLSASALNVPHDAEAGPWNPGIVSPVPRHLRPLETLFRPENAFTRFRDAEELADLTGRMERRSKISVSISAR